MVFSIITHPTRVFTNCFDSPKNGKSLAVVFLTAIITALAGYALLGNVLTAGLFFVTALIQWFVFSIVVWFFGFAHNGRVKKNQRVSFSQIVSVTGKLWTLNLASTILMLFMALIVPYASDILLLIVFAIMAILFIILFIGWIIASIKMIKVVTGAKKGKLVINWIILIILNGMVISFITFLITWAISFY